MNDIIIDNSDRQIGSLSRGRLLLHLGFWLVYASFFLYLISSGRRIEEHGWVSVILDLNFHIIMMVGMSYFNYFVLVPRLIRNKNVVKYLLEFLPIFLIFCVFLILGKQYIIDGFTHESQWVYSFRFYFNVILSAFFLIMFVGLLRFVENYFVLEEHKRELENEKLTSELRFLKSQINPHFLFNTLNNLYYLAMTKAPNTPEIIAKLSQMMRYMLYDSNHNRVLLSKELEYMDNYIALEKLRLNDEIPIDYQVTGDVAGATIAPVVLITFLENAFKHGVSNTRKGSWISINLDVSNDVLTYEIKNSKISDTDKTVNEKSGIGLQNVKRRLELAYPGAYDLTTTENDDSYDIRLELNL